MWDIYKQQQQQYQQEQQDSCILSRLRDKIPGRTSAGGPDAGDDRRSR